jgi:uncharacterized protein (TIGR02145 family)
LEDFVFNIKALVVILTGIQLCMANISGVVTDSAGVKIAGAIVILEQGGQTDTTDSVGSFVLRFDATGISSHSIKQPGNMFATMRNGLLYVNVLEKATVQITIFDLTGKVLSAEQQLMDAGIHSAKLHYRGAGIYIYKVKAGNNEVVLKGNSFSGVSSGSTAFTQVSSSNNPHVKQVKATDTIDDFIKITKDGYLNSRVQVTNPDTMGIEIKMILQAAGTVTDIEGNVYHAIRIGSQVWTVENLRTTKYNDGSNIPYDTSAVNWVADSTPKYCNYKNTTNTDSIKKYGVLYNWYIVSPANPRKIAPTGWHVPSDTEWTVMSNYLIANGYNYDGTVTGNKVAKCLAVKTDWDTTTVQGKIGCDTWENNSSGFSALPGGCRGSIGPFGNMGNYGYWWSATEVNGASVFRTLNNYEVSLGRSSGSKSCGFSVRLVKN